MTTRNPLVRVNGKIVELPAADSIGGAPQGPTGPTGPAGAGGTGSGANFICNGRLTLTSGTPVTTSDVTAATTIYFTPFRGNQISTYDSSTWTGHTFTELSLSLATITSGKNYDVFIYSNSGTMTLELSAAWTNDTTRADALALQDGVLVKSSDHSRRYLGTIRASGAAQTEDSGGGSTTNVGGKRFVWNYYNRVSRFIKVIDTANSWNYTTAAYRQANGNTGNQVEYVCGYNEEAIWASVMGVSTQTSGNSRIAIGLDSTTTPATFIANQAANTTAIGATQTCNYNDLAGLGYHKLVWLEYGTSGCTFYGDNAGSLQSGLAAVING